MKKLGLRNDIELINELPQSFTYFYQIVTPL